MQFMPRSELYLVLIIFMFCGMANAQVPGRIMLGMRSGLNISNVNIQATNTVQGLVAGITSTYGVGEFSGITLEALYSREGYENSTSVVDYDYLQLPLYYNTFIGNSLVNFRPKIYLGVSPGFLLSAKINDVDFKDQNMSVVFNFLGGLGFNYRLADRLWLETDIRAFLGLSEIEINGTRTDPLKNRTLQLSLALSYGL